MIRRAITMIVGQGSGLNWSVDAVHCVPPLTGTQTPSKSDQAVEKAKRTNGREHGALEAPSQQPAPDRQEHKMTRTTSKSARQVGKAVLAKAKHNAASPWV